MRTRSNSAPFVPSYCLSLSESVSEHDDSFDRQLWNDWPGQQFWAVSPASSSGRLPSSSSGRLPSSSSGRLPSSSSGRLPSSSSGGLPWPAVLVAQTVLDASPGWTAWVARSAAISGRHRLLWVAHLGAMSGRHRLLWAAHLAVGRGQLAGGRPANSSGHKRVRVSAGRRGLVPSGWP